MRSERARKRWEGNCRKILARLAQYIFYAISSSSSRFRSLFQPVDCSHSSTIPKECKAESSPNLKQPIHHDVSTQQQVHHGLHHRCDHGEQCIGFHVFATVLQGHVGPNINHKISSTITTFCQNGWLQYNTRPRVVRILQYLERKERVVKKEHTRMANNVQELNAELTEIRTRKEDYLQSQAVGADGNKHFTESPLRSAVKVFMWRIIAGSITFATSLQFSGSVSSSLSIVGSDFCSKMATMFIGERLMNTRQAGRKSGSDTASRSLAKALIWRLFAVVNSLTVAIFVTKDLSVASKIAGSDALCKTSLMYAYERAWAKVEWGKNYRRQRQKVAPKVSTVAQSTR